MADDSGTDPDVSTGMREPCNRQFGDYILGRQLGSGGMGIVYEARQISLNRKVALKFIRNSQVASPLMLRRFTIEAEATARLHHPNIVGIHEIGEIDGQPYFSMDLVEGESLRVLLAQGEFTIKTEADSKSNGRNRQVAVARLMAKAARALHHAHQRGVLHRDLKPANILVDAAGEPRVSDFGLAKILRQTTETDTHQSLTGSGDIAGTPSYMSPEQASSAETTGASDIYGLGAVLYELLTGGPPFRGHTALETLQHVRESPPRTPRSINPLIERDLDTICLKCLEKDLLRRFASAEALAEDLENWIDHRPIRSRPAGTAVRTAQWMKRNRTGTALIAALLVGLSATIVLLAIVNQQSRKRAELTARIFDQKVRALSERWSDTNTTTLNITHEDLAILSNRDPVDAATARPLSIGVVIRNDAISFAARHAALLGELESSLGQIVRQPVQISLSVSKAHVPDADLVEQGQVDFALLNATAFVEAQQRKPGLVAVARLKDSSGGVLAAGARSGVTNLAMLRGKTILFGGQEYPLTIVAMARLARANLTKDQIHTVIVEEEITTRRNSRELLAAVISGKVDAAAAPLRRFELGKHLGLVLLDQFPTSHRVIAARPDLDTNTVAAFRAALFQLHDTRPAGRLDDDFSWEEEVVFGTVAIESNYLDAVRQTMRDAARFNGEPDPFPLTLE
jgi:serine/threonine protein kinase